MSAWDLYPPGWPRCAFCSAPALDGHLTCGRAECPEALARSRQREGPLTEEDVKALTQYLEDRLRLAEGDSADGSNRV